MAASVTSPVQPRAQAQQPAPAPPPVNCHSDAVAQAGIYPDRVGRPEEPTFSSSPAPSPTSSHASQTPVSPACHPERSDERPTRCASPESYREGSHPIPPNQSAPSVGPAVQPNNLRPTRPSAPQPAPNRNAYALHFDHNCRLLVDGNPFRINIYTPLL